MNLIVFGDFNYFLNVAKIDAEFAFWTSCNNLICLSCP
jgi:hypothetical protein